MGPSRQAASVILIPWDPTSPNHVDRMVEQRKQCGWHAEQVSTQWKDAYLAGHRCIYWLAFPETESQRQEYIDIHVKQYPKESDELTDTSTTLLQKPRSPSGEKFLPIGHVALDNRGPSYARGMGTPEIDAYWIKGLYVSYVLQGSGIGKAAMITTEKIATQEPLNARHLLLDTVYHEDQLDEAYAMATYGGLFKASP